VNTHFAENTATAACDHRSQPRPGDDTMSMAQIDLVARTAGAAAKPLVPRVAGGYPDSTPQSSQRSMLIGMLIVTLLPTLFWTGAILMGCALFNIALSTTTLLLISASIGAFLTIVGSVLLAGR
jgi:hypothetical protein